MYIRVYIYIYIYIYIHRPIGLNHISLGHVSGGAPSRLSAVGCPSKALEEMCRL